MQSPEPNRIQLSNITGSHKSASRSLSDLTESVVKAFAQMHSNSILGSASNEWQRIVDRCPKLGNDEYPKKLAEVVAIALVGSL